jgi:Tripartite tricarboxylate transporter TctB family
VLRSSNAHSPKGGRGRTSGRFWSDAFVLAGALVLLWVSTSIQDFGLDVLGPAFMPRFVLCILIGLAGLDIAIIWWSAPEQKAEENDDPEFEVAIRPRSLAVLGVLTAYVAALSTGSISFELASVLFVILTGIIAGARTKRTIMLLIAVSVVYALAAGWIFRSVFFVALP